jgi:hypothetical protein
MAGEGGWWRRADPNALLIGASVAIATIVIGTGIAIYLTTDAATDDGRASGLSTSDSTTTTRNPRASTSSSTASSAPSTTLPTTGGPGTPGSRGGGSPAPEPAPPPTPRATADPEDPPYQPTLPPAAGATSSLEGCEWSPVNGGELQAWGTLTSYVEDDSFTVEVIWLQNDRELDSLESDFIDFELPGIRPWRLVVPAPLEPLDVRCAVEIF